MRMSSTRIVDIVAAPPTRRSCTRPWDAERPHAAEVCEVIQFLADHGAALDELDDAGRTPLAAADGLPVDQAVDLLTKLITDRGGKPKVASVR